MYIFWTRSTTFLFDWNWYSDIVTNLVSSCLVNISTSLENVVDKAIGLWMSGIVLSIFSYTGINLDIRHCTGSFSICRHYCQSRWHSEWQVSSVRQFFQIIFLLFEDNGRYGKLYWYWILEMLMEICMYVISTLITFNI